jgi:alanine dehydrogenase
VDDIRQCRTDGEINVPLTNGLIHEQDIVGEIGEVITRKKQGRRTDDENTLFDSTGIALQDSATAPRVGCRCGGRKEDDFDVI